MKVPQKLAVFSAAIFIMSGILPGLPLNAAGQPATQSSSLSGEAVTVQEPATVSGGDPAIPVPDTPPAFSAEIISSSEGYKAIGSLSELPPDTCHVEPLYSPDGTLYQPCGNEWSLKWVNSEGGQALEKLLNQTCLYSSQEPLKSYLAGKTDRFYLKLRLTRADGTVYETQEAIIDRGEPQPLPEEITPTAIFASSMRIRETRPFRYCGRYQLTVSEHAAAEDISALLPDTVPIEITLQKGLDAFTEGVIECPVTWKPLALTQLAAGESMSIEDAAEKLTVPAGTLVNTPMGIFRLEKPLDVSQGVISDDICLVLNIIAENESPTGILHRDNAGLEVAFNLKPTGATAIRAYTISAGEASWAALPELSLPDCPDSQPSAANSGYMPLLGNLQEPFCSYLAAEAAGVSPVPFYVGLKIEGGVYDGRQLILSWPGTYDPLPVLPQLGGAGGNEGNAGADNKNDSTEDGQRPGLPQVPEDDPQEQKPAASQEPDDDPQEQKPAASQEPDDEPQEQKPAASQEPDDGAQEQEQAPVASPEPEDNPQAQKPPLTSPEPEHHAQAQVPAASQKPPAVSPEPEHGAQAQVPAASQEPPAASPEPDNGAQALVPAASQEPPAPSPEPDNSAQAQVPVTSQEPENYAQEPTPTASPEPEHGAQAQEQHPQALTATSEPEDNQTSPSNGNSPAENYLYPIPPAGVAGICIAVICIACILLLALHRLIPTRQGGR